MAYTNFYNEVCFIEGDYEVSKKVGKIKSDLSFKIGAQLKNLNDVKADLAKKAKKKGCNCITNFKYGQKSRWLAIDDVAFYGEGIGTILDKEEYRRIDE